MYNNKRKVTLLQRMKPSTFVKINAEFYSFTSRSLGASHFAEKTLLSKGDFLKAILPVIIGIDSNASDWRNVITKYLHTINIDVPKGGKDLNISLIFDMDNERTKANIAKLTQDAKTRFENEEALSNYVNGFNAAGVKNVEEIDKYKYATPEEPSDYFNYIYASYHNRVANHQDLIDKSSSILFYMVTESDVKDAKVKRYELNKRITKIMLTLDSDDKKFDAICTVLKITDTNRLDRSIALDDLSKSDPERVVNAINDKNLLTKAQIENYIAKGLFNRLPNSNMIVDSVNPAEIIGVNMDAAVTYFNNSTNDAALSQYAAAYKSLNS